MLRQSARSLLESECPSTAVRRMMEDERGYSPNCGARWPTSAGLGLVMPEEHGGAGLNYVDLVVVAEEMGRVLLPSPFIWTLMFAEAISTLRHRRAEAAACCPRSRAANWSPRLLIWRPRQLGGKRYHAGARKSGAGLPARRRQIVRQRRPCRRLLPGRGAHRRQSGSGGVTLFAIDAKRAGVAVTPLKTMDQTRKLGAVTFRGVRAAAADVVGEVDDGWPVLAAAIDRGKVMLAAEMMGGAQKVLDIDGRVRQGARAIRPSDRQFPGRPAQVREHDDRCRGREVRDLLRRVGGQQ